jgi:serine/threonine-protein kinase
VVRASPAIRLVGRYALYDKIAAGGMASVHFGRLLGPSGFARTVAVKCLFPQFAGDPDFVAMFLDEARVVSRIRSPYVVPTLDVVHVDDELCIVMEYIAGESLGRLMQPSSQADAERAPSAPTTLTIPVAVAVTILAEALEGLHAAHEARSEQGTPLGIVHRDVSPQNILVGTDGLGHVIDFGVAKAAGRLQTTREGQLKGKIAYMAPEQLRGDAVTRRSDVYAASVVLWEALTGQRLFRTEDEASTVTRVLMGEVSPPSRSLRPGRDLAEVHAVERLDAIVMRGLDRDPARRFETARDMAAALEVAVAGANAAAVGAWLEQVAGPALARRAARVAEIESGTAGTMPPEPAMPVEPMTQASSISVSTTVSATSPTRRRSIGIALAFVGMLGLAGLLRATWHGRTVTPSLASATGSAMPSSGPLAVDPGPPSSSAVPDAPPVATESASVTSAATPSSAPTPRRRPVTSPAADCNPPYTWDAQGKKHYKRNCL